MTKEVTKTTVTVAKIQNQEGVFMVQKLPEEIIIGNVSAERAQKEIRKKYKDDSINVTGVFPETTIYEMPVEEFIKVATIKPEKESDAETE